MSRFLRMDDNAVVDLSSIAYVSKCETSSRLFFHGRCHFSVMYKSGQSSNFYFDDWSKCVRAQKLLVEKLLVMREVF